MDGGLYSKAKGMMMSNVGMIIAAVVLLIILYYAYYSVASAGQSFMPTATMRYQQNDNALVMSPEHMCGGMDQCCKCSGNETMSTTRDINSNDLSRVAMGL